MTKSDNGDDEPLSPAQAQIVAKVRWLMLISGAATMLGIAVVITVIGYRVFRSGGSPPAGAGDLGGANGRMIEMTAPLPKGARVVSTAVAGERIVVTLDIGGTVEIRTYDARTLRPEGRMRFTDEP